MRCPTRTISRRSPWTWASRATASSRRHSNACTACRRPHLRIGKRVDPPRPSLCAVGYSQEHVVRIPEGFVHALVAPSRHDSIPAEMDIYAPVLGDWDIAGTEHLAHPPKP